MANNIADLERVNIGGFKKEAFQKASILETLDCQKCFTSAANQTDKEEFANDTDMFNFYQALVELCISKGGC